jgi:hypothetical protein
MMNKVNEIIDIFYDLTFILMLHILYFGLPVLFLISIVIGILMTLIKKGVI